MGQPETFVEKITNASEGFYWVLVVCVIGCVLSTLIVCVTVYESQSVVPECRRLERENMRLQRLVQSFDAIKSLRAEEAP